MNERLCTECIPQNKCWFVNKFNERMHALPPSDEQTRIAPGDKITKEAYEVSVLIEKDRIIAESYGCTQKDYNPEVLRFRRNL